MKKTLSAYWNLRKNFLVAIYILIVVAGFCTILFDRMNYRTLSADFDKYASEEQFNKTRDSLIRLEKLGQGQVKYIDLTMSDIYQSENVNTENPEVFDYIDTYNSAMNIDIYDKTLRDVIEYLPKDFSTYKKSVLSYYGSQDINSRYYSSTKNVRLLGGVNYSLNNTAVMPMLMLMPILLLIVVILDQNRKFSPLFTQRTRNRNKLVFAQLFYWLGGSTIVIALMTLVNMLTKRIFIPDEYVNISWAASMNSFAFLFGTSLLMIVYGIFVDALVGKTSSKIVTSVLGVPAVLVALALYIPESMSEYVFDMGVYTELLIAVVTLLPIAYFLNLQYSFEQDSVFIRLEKLRIPFYIGILIFILLDLVIPIFTRKTDIASAFIILLLSGFFAVVFANQVLGKNIFKKNK